MDDQQHYGGITVEPKLLNYKECYDNIDLFKIQNFPTDSDRFVRCLIDGTPSAFYWMSGGIHHRVDGPALIYKGGGRHWYFLGEYANVENQADFEKWLAIKIMGI